MSERKASDKVKINRVIEGCTDERFQRFVAVCGLTLIFKKVHLICSSEDTPISAFVILVYAMRNEISVALQAEQFDKFLGKGSAAEVAELIYPRFNLGGEHPVGRKVGLLNKFHLWAALCDPYFRDWRSTFELEGNLANHINEMIAYFVPDDKRKEVKDECMVSIFTQ